MYVSDNAALLSRVQQTLRGQVETLAQRAHARLLTASDEEIATFAEHLVLAGEAMIPAAERLGEIELEQALFPEQEALQHLLAAEAVFTDISVSLQANNRGGGGGQAGRDLTEMFELEMDLEKNQYESGSTASPDPPQQQLNDAADELGDLARRQELLARNLDRTRTPTPAQRWQQEMLRRDVEELRERLERMQQQAANESQSQSGQSGQRSQSGQQGSQGQQGESSREIDELRRRLESAVRAMNEVDEAMRNGGDPDDLRRASEEAQRQLEGARDRALEEQQRMLQASVSDLTNRADDLYETQSALEDRLQEAVRSILIGRNDLNRLDSGLSMEEEYEIAEEKRRLQAELQSLEQDARNTARALDDAEPRAAEEIRKAIETIRELEIEARLAVAAAYIEQGEAIYIAGSESAVTQGLRELRDDMQRAEDMTRQGNGAGRGGEGRDDFAETLAETQRLRRELQRLAEGNATGGSLTNRAGTICNSPPASASVISSSRVNWTARQTVSRRVLSTCFANYAQQARPYGTSMNCVAWPPTFAPRISAAIRTCSTPNHGMPCLWSSNWSWRLQKQRARTMSAFVPTRQTKFRMSTRKLSPTITASSVRLKYPAISNLIT